jgi:hypothetical protein
MMREVIMMKILETKSTFNNTETRLIITTLVFQMLYHLLSLSHSTARRKTPAVILMLDPRVDLSP